MNRNFGIGILVFCFGLSSVNAGLADQVEGMAPIVVQPYEIQELNQQMLDRDRKNRDEEIAIKELIEENNKLTQTSLAHQEDEGLAKVNQTMLSYRDALLSRDRAHIVSNGQRWWTSRYGDLIALTEDADAMTVHHDLVDKSDLLAQKYQMLTNLKDEMTALNEKLTGENKDALNQKEEAISGLKKTEQQEQDKIQLLVKKLGDMDQKITRLDDTLSQKEEQIAQLKDNLSKVKSEAADKDAMINDQKNQINVLQEKAQGLSSKEEQARSQADILSLKNQIQQKVDDLKSKDAMIEEQKNQIGILEKLTNKSSPKNGRLDQLVAQLAEKQGQVDLLKDELEDKITELKTLSQELSSKDAIIKQQENQAPVLKGEANPGQELSSKDETIKEQKNQIAVLQQQAQELSPKEGHVAVSEGNQEKINFLKDQIQQQTNALKTKDDLIKTEEDQIAGLSRQVKDRDATFDTVKAKILVLKSQVKNQLQQQADALKAKDESIRWLNQVVAAAKNKADYYKLTVQQDQLSMQQVQQEVQKIKDDFAQRFKNYDRFEDSISSLKDQVGQLGAQLADKKQQVGLLKEELEDKITELKNQSRQQAQIEQDLKTRLQEKQDQIAGLKGNLQTIQQGQSNDDRLKLARQLINLHQQEESLLDEKGNLALQQYDIFDRQFTVFENKMKILLENHRIQAIDVQDRMEVLKDELGQKQQEIDSLKGQLEEKITLQKDQDQLGRQIQDLKARLQGKEDQIIRMNKDIKEGLETKEEADSLKQQLADQKDKADQLKQQLDGKIAESDKMTLMMADYQKKLESKDNSYNEQYAKLRQKEAQLVGIKKEMYDLQELGRDKDMDVQAKDLSLSIMQQKMMDEKTNEYQGKINGLQEARDRQAQEIRDLKTELALARQQLDGMPSSDEIDFLRAGLKKATAQLKQKDEMLSQIRADAGEYEKEFKEQSLEFQGLKGQLQSAYDEINRQDEDLKDKDLEIVRFKERSATGEGDWQAKLKQKDEMLSQMKASADEYKKEFKAQSLEFQSLKEQLQDANDEISRRNEDLKYKNMEVLRLKERSKIGKSGHEDKVDVLETQLMDANAQIKVLRTQLNQFILPSKKDPVREKLKQALDKINEQGRMINVLAQKLQECGQGVNLTQNAGK